MLTIDLKNYKIRHGFCKASLQPSGQKIVAFLITECKQLAKALKTTAWSAIIWHPTSGWSWQMACVVMINIWQAILKSCLGLYNLLGSK